MMYAISCYTGPRYNSTWLFLHLRNDQAGPWADYFGSISTRVISFSIWWNKIHIQCWMLLACWNSPDNIGAQWCSERAVQVYLIHHIDYYMFHVSPFAGWLVYCGPVLWSQKTNPCGMMYMLLSHPTPHQRFKLNRCQTPPEISST